MKNSNELFEIFYESLYYFLIDLMFSNQFASGMANLSFANITVFTILLPPLFEQHRIVTKVDQLLTLCDELEQSIRQNQEYTQKLLQVALKEALEPAT